ncbi:MAG: hypothetical protein M3081_01935 [Gemmatimonadota bacterium]|nr:hypothetical protein [Gemmatimonadota bacterium]
MRTATRSGAIARGSTARTTMGFIRREHGDVVLNTILMRLGAEERKQVRDAVMSDQLPYDALVAFWRSADASLRDAHPKWMEEAGAFSINSVGQQLYGGLLRKTSPIEFVTQSVSLFKLYYAPGDIVSVEVDVGRAVLRLLGFDAIDPLFCRRQSGGLLRATELAGGRRARVRHVRCTCEGDAFCEWEISWS